VVQSLRIAAALFLRVSEALRPNNGIQVWFSYNLFVHRVFFALEDCTMAVKPLGDKILVKRLEAQEVTKGGIVLPDSAKEKPKEGRVVEVGPGKVLDDGPRGSMQIKKGDRILFTSYAGTEIKVDKEEFLIMSEDDVLAVVGE
jgi:chaperonin GroES